MRVKKVVLKDNYINGAFSVITPKMIVEERAILGMGGYTKINQCLKKNFIHFGQPTKKIGRKRR